MKAIIVSLASIMLLQLSSTMANTTDIFGQEPQIMPATDKRYPLLNFIVTSIYEQESLELVTETVAHIKMLQDFDSLLERFKPDTRYAELQADLQKEIEQFKTLAEDLKKDATNCEKKTKLIDFIATSAHKHTDIRPTSYGVDYKRRLHKFRIFFPEFVARHFYNDRGVIRKLEREVAKHEDEAGATVVENMKTFITPFYVHVREAVEKFVATLNENEKKEYAETMAWCEETLAADTPYKVYQAFDSLKSVFTRATYLPVGDRDKAVCTWDFKMILDFFHFHNHFLRPKE